MVPSPPQAKTVSLPAATAQRVLSVASWLERHTVRSVCTPADWRMPMAWFNSASRFFPRRPELGLKRMVALRMRWTGTALSLTHAPFPHTERRLLRDRVSRLAGQHGDLSAVVGIVRDQIREETSHVRTKAFDAAVAVEGRVENFPERGAARLQGFFSLAGRDAEPVELLGHFDLAFCGLQPHHPDVMHVRNHASNVAALFPGRLGAPRFGGQIIQQISIDAVVGVKGREQSFGENEGRDSFFWHGG